MDSQLHGSGPTGSPQKDPSLDSQLLGSGLTERPEKGPDESEPRSQVATCLTEWLRPRPDQVHGQWKTQAPLSLENEHVVMGYKL